MELARGVTALEASILTLGYIDVQGWVIAGVGEGKGQSVQRQIKDFDKTACQCGDSRLLR